MNTPYGFNSTQDFQTCEEYWRLAYDVVHPDDVERKKLENRDYAGLQGATKSQHLAFGSAYHDACHFHDLNPSDTDGFFAAFHKRWDFEVSNFPNLEDHTEWARRLGDSAIASYLLEYANDPLEILHSEEGMRAVDLEDPVWPGTKWPYTFKCDAIARYAGHVCIVERKTSSSTPAQFFPNFYSSRGPTGYIYGVRRYYPECTALLLEVAFKPRSKSGSVIHQRELIIRSDPAEFERWFLEECSLRRSREQKRRGDDIFVRNTSQCHNFAGFHSKCSMYELCSAPAQNVPLIIMDAYSPRNWNEDEEVG